MSRLPPLSQLRTKNIFNLPRLPIPTLEATAARYVNSLHGIQPVLDSATAASSTTSSNSCSSSDTRTPQQRMTDHIAVLEKFVSTSGPKIQQELISRDAAAAHSGEYPFSYIEPLWDDGYLDFDEPCPVNVAPGFTSKPLDPSWSQSLVAAKLVRTCGKWFIAASEGNLPLPWNEAKGGKPVCVAGMPLQMGFCRKPGALRDASHIAHTPEAALRYAAVLRHGHLFLVSLVNQQGKLRSEKSLVKAFDTILAATSPNYINRQSAAAAATHAAASSAEAATAATASSSSTVVSAFKPGEFNEFPISALTTGNRRDWFKARSSLKDADPGNLANLRYIEDSLCVVCLDDIPVDSTLATLNGTVRLDNNLVGHGVNGANRWYDKHQLIVSNVPGEGFGVTAEHAFSDGIAWSKWINAVYEDMVSGGNVLPEPPSNFMLVNNPPPPIEIHSNGNHNHNGNHGTTTTAETAATTATAPEGKSADKQQHNNNSHHHHDHSAGIDPNHHHDHHHNGNSNNHHLNDEDEALHEAPVTESERKNHKKVKIRGEPAGIDEGNGVVRLQFRLPDASKAAIKKAMQEHSEVCANLKQVAVVLPFGKNDCKRTFKVGPDVLCQASFHLAYARLHRIMAPTYESCSTEKFFHGRTETIRSATPEMNAFIRSALRAGCNVPAASGGGGGGPRWPIASPAVAECVAMLRKAAEAHKVVATDAANGMGVDRHLLALKSLVKELADPNGLAFFSEPMYGESGTWLMSTSNVSQPSLNWFSFGPVTPAGYGLGYCVHDDAVNVGLSSFRDSDGQSDAAAMAEHVEAAGRDIAELLSRK